MPSVPPCEYLTLAVPNFNGARFLARTLESLNANGRAVRWWLQDNYSTDDSISIAKALERPGDVICQEKDLGQPDAINRAFSRMGGEIIGFMNSDDCLCKGAADAVLGFFNTNPQIDIIYGEIEWIDAEDRVFGTHSGKIDSLEELLDVFHVWWAKRQWVQPEVFFRRSLWEKAGPISCQYNLAFDYDFWVRCFRAGARSTHLPEKLAKFRIHENQKSRRAEEAAAEIRAILQDHLKERLPIPKKLQWQLRKHLEYEDYRLANHDHKSFTGMLLRHPDWLLVPEVRDRIRINLGDKLK